MTFSIRRMKTKIREAVAEARQQANEITNTAAEWIDSKFETKAEKAQAAHLQKLAKTLDAVRDDAEEMAEELAQTRANLEAEKRSTSALRISLREARDDTRRWQIATALATAAALTLGVLLAAGMA